MKIQLGRQIWSLAERFTYRASSAIVIMLVATKVSPAEMGVWAWFLLGFTLLSALTDNPVQFLGLMAIQSEEGRSFIRKYQRLVIAIGPISLALYATFVTIGITNSPWSYGLPMYMVSIVVIFQAIKAPHIAKLQHNESWRLIAEMQFLAIAISLIAAYFAYLSLHGFWAIAIQIVVSEVLFACFVVFKSKSAKIMNMANFRKYDFSKEFRIISSNHLLSWIQSQTDRLILGIWGNLQSVGLYSFGNSVGRNAGEVTLSALVNVNRKSIFEAATSSPARVASKMERILLGNIVVILPVLVVNYVLFQVLIKRFYGPEWGVAFHVGAIISITALSTNISWNLNSLLISLEKARALFTLRAISIASTIPIGIAACYNLVDAANLLVVKEVGMMFIYAIGLKSASPWKVVLLTTILSSILIYLVQVL